MTDVVINFWAVLLAAVAAMMIGSLWYSPAMFGKEWLALVGKREEDLKPAEAGPAYFWTTVGSLVSAYVLAYIIGLMGAANIWSGVLAGFWIWLGFQVFMMVSGSLFEGRPLRLVFINAGNSLVTLLVMGAILGAWL